MDLKCKCGETFCLVPAQPEFTAFRDLYDKTIDLYRKSGWVRETRLENGEFVLHEFCPQCASNRAKPNPH